MTNTSLITQPPSQLVDLFLSLHVSPNTQQTYGRALALFLDWLSSRAIHPLQVAANVSMALSFRDHIYATYPNEATAAAYLAAIKSFYKTLKGLGLIQLNVWEVVRVKSPSQESTTQTITPDHLEAAYARAAELGPKTLLMIRLLYEAALRREEVAGLQKASLIRAGKGWALKITGKGDKTASVGISDDLAEALREFGASTEGEYYFPGQKAGTAITPRTVNNIVDSLGLDLHPHQFRHSHVTDSLLAGETIQDVSRTVRHSNLQTTMRYYTTLTRVERSTARTIKPPISRRSNATTEETDLESKVSCASSI